MNDNAQLNRRFDEHAKSDESHFMNINGKFDKVEEKLDMIKDNHLAHMQSDMNDINLNLSKNTNDTDWLKRFFWIVATASLGGLIASIMNLLK